MVRRTQSGGNAAAGLITALITATHMEIGYADDLPAL
jgi:hypothetical protein